MVLLNKERESMKQSLHMWTYILSILGMLSHGPIYQSYLGKSQEKLYYILYSLLISLILNFEFISFNR